MPPPPLGRFGARCLAFLCLADSRRARTFCLLPMLGGSLSISCSSYAQKAADRLPQSRQWRARAFR
eukprot:1905023-Prymnesium_polylepis.1